MHDTQRNMFRSRETEEFTLHPIASLSVSWRLNCCEGETYKKQSHSWSKDFLNSDPKHFTPRSQSPLQVDIPIDVIPPAPNKLLFVLTSKAENILTFHRYRPKPWRTYAHCYRWNHPGTAGRSRKTQRRRPESYEISLIVQIWPGIVTPTCRHHSRRTTRCKEDFTTKTQGKTNSNSEWGEIFLISSDEYLIFISRVSSLDCSCGSDV